MATGYFYTIVVFGQSIAENPRSEMPKSRLAKYFAQVVIGNPQSPIENGLKKLQDLKEQQMVSLIAQTALFSHDFIF